MLDENCIAFADFRGNRQYISAGNLAENPKAYLFPIDYSTRQRIKLWGTARIVEGDPALVERLIPPSYKEAGEQAVLFMLIRGTPTARSIFRSVSMQPTWPRRWRRAIDVSPNSKRKFCDYHKSPFCPHQGVRNGNEASRASLH